MRFGFLSSYPPTLCGLATFTAALAGALEESLGCSFCVVRALDAPERLDLPDVAGEVWAGDSLSRRRAADSLNACDVTVIQHEYGIYGGLDGEEVLDVMRRLRVPKIVVLHTVLTQPTPHQKKVLEAVMAEADVMVTMSNAARDRLLAGYRTDPRRVVVIPHGAAPAPSAAAAPAAGAPTDGPRILTWGLIGPGKGIEWAVEAMASLRDLDPQPHYLVAGQTHPKVVAREGERYREGLRRRAGELGIDGMIRFDQAYRPTSEIPALIASADIVLLPYDSTEQVTSGVLIEAVAAGRPVVSTRFPHAVELLAGGVGVTVPHRDPDAIAAALRRLLTDPAEADRMHTQAVRSAASLHWPAVAGRYLSLAQGIVAGRLGGALLEDAL
jgi:polysaccharide biosynthesis protein PslF